MNLFTIGHSTRTLDAFVAALVAAGSDCVADVRRFPRSRRHPHFNAETLAPALAAAGILYRSMPALGGRRGPLAAGPSPHTLWREEAFRNYADYAQSGEFRAGLARLLALAGERRVAVMCAEAQWRQCHRRIIADYLLAAGSAVTHIVEAGKTEPAQLTPGALLRADGSLLYAEQYELL